MMSGFGISAGATDRAYACPGRQRGGDPMTSPAVAGVEAGQVLAGKYRIDRVLGAGGMGDLRHGVGKKLKRTRRCCSRRWTHRPLDSPSSTGVSDSFA